MYENMSDINRINNQNLQAIYKMYSDESTKYMNTKNVLEEKSRKLGYISNEIERIQEEMLSSLYGGASVSEVLKYMENHTEDLRILKNIVKEEKASIDNFLEDPSKENVFNAPYTELLN